MKRVGYMPCLDQRQLNKKTLILAEERNRTGPRQDLCVKKSLSRREKVCLSLI